MFTTSGCELFNHNQIISLWVSLFLMTVYALIWGSGWCQCTSFLPQCPRGLLEWERGQRGNIDRNGNDRPRQCLPLKWPFDHHPRKHGKNTICQVSHETKQVCMSSPFHVWYISLTHHVPAEIKQVCLVWPCFHQWSYQGIDCHSPPHYQQSEQLCLLLPPHAGPFVQRSNFWNTQEHKLSEPQTQKFQTNRFCDFHSDWLVQSFMAYTGNLMYLISKAFPKCQLQIQTY